MKMLAVLSLFWLHPPQDVPDPKREAVRKALEELVKDKGELAKLAVGWDDLHGLHGGLRLRIAGDGKATQESVREKTGELKEKVDPKDLKELIQLLVKLEAWAQRVPERPAVPDESRARLTIAAGDSSVTVWEWFNDLGKNKRLVEVRDLMKKIAWK